MIVVNFFLALSLTGRGGHYPISSCPSWFYCHVKFLIERDSDMASTSSVKQSGGSALSAVVITIIANSPTKARALIG